MWDVESLGMVGGGRDTVDTATAFMRSRVLWLTTSAYCPLLLSSFHVVVQQLRRLEHPGLYMSIISSDRYEAV
jgi:hypothetical protein